MADATTNPRMPLSGACFLFQISRVGAIYGYLIDPLIQVSLDDVGVAMIGQMVTSPPVDIGRDLQARYVSTSWAVSRSGPSLYECMIHLSSHSRPGLTCGLTPGLQVSYDAARLWSRLRGNPHIDFVPFGDADVVRHRRVPYLDGVYTAREGIPGVDSAIARGRRWLTRTASLLGGVPVSDILDELDHRGDSSFNRLSAGAEGHHFADPDNRS